MWGRHSLDHAKLCKSTVRPLQGKPDGIGWIMLSGPVERLNAPPALPSSACWVLALALLWLSLTLDPLWFPGRHSCPCCYCC